jgi:hypothetical protein
LESNLENQTSKIIVGTIDNTARRAAAPGELLSGIPTEPNETIGNSPKMSSVISSSLTEPSGTLNGLFDPNSPGKSGLEIELEIAEVVKDTDVGGSDKVFIPPELAEVTADKLEKVIYVVGIPNEYL